MCAKKQISLWGIKKEHTRVVRLQKKNGKLVDEYDVYIGRAVKYGVWNLERSIWANPFKLGKNGLDTTQKVLNAYESHVRSNVILMSKLHTLKGKRLGCWCKPKPCHGDGMASDDRVFYIKEWNHTQKEDTELLGLIDFLKMYYSD